MAKVQGDASLVAVQAQVVGTSRPISIAPPGGTLGSGLVAYPWLFNLDNVGSKIAQNHGGQRPGQHPAEIGDAEVAKGPLAGPDRCIATLLVGVVRLGQRLESRSDPSAHRGNAPQGRPLTGWDADS